MIPPHACGTEYVNITKAILYQEVRELPSSYVHIYIFMLLFLVFIIFFFLHEDLSNTDNF